MIKASFSREESGLRAIICGHAGYSESGADIVCAAVSGIVYAMLGYLANSGAYLKINSIGSGVADIECDPSGEEAMKLCCIGLIQIALTYPGTVSVDSMAWGWRIKPPVYAACRSAGA